MKRSQNVTSSVCALAAMVLGIFWGPVLGQAPTPAQTPAQTPAAQGQGGQGRAQAAPPLIDAQHLRMPAEARDQHASVAVFGSQSTEGYYIVGQYLGPHQTSRPHYHDKDRWVTVVKGTWYTGEGDVFKPETMVPLKPGSVMFHPAGAHHYDGSIGDEEVLLLIAGYGPVTTVQTEVDEQGNPVSRGAGGNRGRGAAPAAGAPAAGR